MSGKKYSDESKFGDDELEDELEDEFAELEVIEPLEQEFEEYSASLRDDVEGIIETLPTKESRGFIRLEKHMGSGEGKI